MHSQKSGFASSTNHATHVPSPTLQHRDISTTPRPTPIGGSFTAVLLHESFSTIKHTQ
ncbi:conserved hypothetical protein [Ricinus communis]|uniref:Uncharacterized protein n=1 Tax=Ricinus communis TaxID=3988 RepID=B9REX8_RICCO|nr:conserved hypothetical protein [Ricinus communis]